MGFGLPEGQGRVNLVRETELGEVWNGLLVRRPLELNALDSGRGRNGGHPYKRLSSGEWAQVANLRYRILAGIPCPFVASGTL